MQEAVLAGLRTVSGGVAADSWRIQLVGGGRRLKSVHDADFLVANPHVQTEGVLGCWNVGALGWQGRLCLN